METKLSGVSFGNCQANIRKLGDHGRTYSVTREPDNQADPNAIRVEFIHDKLGYIPKECNKELAEMMDAGRRFVATFVRLNQFQGADTVGITVDIEEY